MSLATTWAVLLGLWVAPASAAEASRLTREIAAAEYHVSWQDGALQAPNHAHGLRAHFTPSGIRVVPREDPTQVPTWEWGLALTGWGRPDAIAPVEAAEPAPRARVPTSAARSSSGYERAPRPEQGLAGASARRGGSAYN
jgi:hypothetical protein